MEKLMEAIKEFTERHGNEVCFIGSFFTFNKKGDVKEDRMIAHGTLEQMNIQIEAFQEALKEETDKVFVSWCCPHPV